VQSFNTSDEDSIESCQPAESRSEAVPVGHLSDVAPGQRVTLGLSNGIELALFNINGEFYATSNFCPHKGAPLVEGKLCGHTIECEWHGWKFDVRTGRCLTTNEHVEVYRVYVEDGIIKIEIPN
jgi:nitrite reductase/ring-hydroxylating ferredoxin subunit